MRSRDRAALVLIALAVSGAAWARQGRRQVALTGKAGVGTFTGQLDRYTETGAVWGATLGLFPLRVLGLELSYDGSRNPVTDPRLPDGEVALMRHGGSALLRLSPPLVERIKPFLGAGVGASFLTVTGPDGGLFRNDVIEEVPLVAGIEFNTGPLTAGVRGTYRLLWDENFASPAVETGSPAGNLVEMSASLGGRF